jgi:hypothetical protein
MIIAESGFIAPIYCSKMMTTLVEFPDADKARNLSAPDRVRLPMLRRNCCRSTAMPTTVTATDRHAAISSRRCPHLGLIAASGDEAALLPCITS